MTASRRDAVRDPLEGTRDHQGAGRRVPRAHLYELARAGLVERQGRGLYVAKGHRYTADHALAQVARRVSGGVVCLLSALRFHLPTRDVPARDDEQVAFAHREGVPEGPREAVFEDDPALGRESAFPRTWSASALGPRRGTWRPGRARRPEADRPEPYLSLARGMAADVWMAIDRRARLSTSHVIQGSGGFRSGSDLG